MEQHLDSLIKERKNIVVTPSTVTKYSDEQQTDREVKSLEIARTSDLRITELLNHNKNSLTLSFCPGISVFQLLEQLHLNGDDESIFKILDKLACDMLTLQSSSHFAIEVPYPFAQKLSEIKEVMLILDQKKPYNLLKKIEQQVVTALNDCPHLPFRDATPKNYIVKNVFTLSDVTSIDDLEIIAIDFATFHFGTHAYDDLISLFFHYIVSETNRAKLIEKYMPDFATDAAQAILVLRLGRFWVRRAYYKKFHPELFKIRYKLEDISFYERHFFDSLEAFNRLK
ncbi:hypothetical protein KC926_02400 [Candidatus Kaiserbacteria bacterium]|nr:hypothetical protein [Candidatus Kaiserbacteria bacterium]